MTLRAAAQNLDLCSAINRLLIHDDPVELRLLTDEQFRTYLNTLPPDMQREICQAINRQPPGENDGAT